MLESRLRQNHTSSYFSFKNISKDLVSLSTKVYCTTNKTRKAPFSAKTVKIVLYINCSV